MVSLPADVFLQTNFSVSGMMIGQREIFINRKILRKILSLSLVIGIPVKHNGKKILSYRNFLNVFTKNGGNDEST